MQNKFRARDGNGLQVKKKAEAGYAVLSCECGAGNCSTLNMHLQQQPEIFCSKQCMYLVTVLST